MEFPMGTDVYQINVVPLTHLAPAFFAAGVPRWLVSRSLYPLFRFQCPLLPHIAERMNGYAFDITHPLDRCSAPVAYPNETDTHLIQSWCCISAHVKLLAVLLPDLFSDMIQFKAVVRSIRISAGCDHRTCRHADSGQAGNL